MEKELHIISTGMQEPGELVERIKQMYPYIDYLHLRERKWTIAQHFEVIEKLLEAGVPQGKIIVNNQAIIAHKAKVAGVQLPSCRTDVKEIKKKFPGLKIGCSIHGVKEAKRLEKAGADFVLYGHIFTTKSKQGLPPRGLAKLQHIVESVSIPVIAIGGITPRHVPLVMQTGAKGIAVLSGVLLQDNVQTAVKQYINQMRKEG